MWLPSFLRRSEPLPHVVFSRSKAAARKQAKAYDDMTSKLISELSAKGMHIPARLRPTSPDGRG